MRVCHAKLIGMYDCCKSVQGRVEMENVVETRQEWAAPELKKIDVEQITAYGFGTTGDHFNSRS
jgi:hypothetical protein